MHGFYIENRKLHKGISLSQDLAQHILTRGAHGPVIVTTSNPHELISTMGKQWRALIRVIERERASTLNRDRIVELTNQIGWMENTLLTIKLSKPLAENSVTFTRLGPLLNAPSLCSTLYLIDRPSDEEFYLITSWLSQRSVVVCYSR